MIVWLISIAVVVYGSLTPLAAVPVDVPYVDKIIHFLAYLWLAVLPVIGYRSPGKALLLSLCMVPLGIALEMGQLYVPGRDGSFGDMVTNGMGVLAGTVFGGLLKRSGRAMPSGPR
ncbi:MAG: VanZ family protein [Deltaproteobacteria bacterium]|nr:VanZ family protein [Deltaproteobacteria bacterium]